jgi:hypothetical protein
MTSVVPIKSREKSGMHRCSGHVACQGPHLRHDHDKVCDAGEECDSEFCWEPCEFCVPDGHGELTAEKPK